MPKKHKMPLIQFLAGLEPQHISHLIERSVREGLSKCAIIRELIERDIEITQILSDESDEAQQGEL